VRRPRGRRYTGLENQLYRVEIHAGGPVATATFKWSRDSAVAAAVTNVNPHARSWSSRRRTDERLRFSGGDWVEITDDWRS
jgi:hypothetical protein